MISEASTPAPEQAIACESPACEFTAHKPALAETVSGVLIIRIFLFVVLAGLVALIGGALMLGAFPPTPAPQAVEKVVPNDKFGSH